MSYIFKENASLIFYLAENFYVELYRDFQDIIFKKFEIFDQKFFSQLLY